MYRIAAPGMPIHKVILVLLAFGSAVEANGSKVQYRNSAQGNDTTIAMLQDQDTSSFIYISFAGNKYFKQAMKSQYVIETYRLPVSVYYDLKKLTSQPERNKAKADKKISMIIYPYREGLKMYGIKHQAKYKTFYPRGLHAGDCINEMEFKNWDFYEPFQIAGRIRVLRSKPDSMAMISYFDSVKNLNLIRMSAIPCKFQQQEVCYNTWDRDLMKLYRTPVIKEMDKFVAGLMKNLGKYSSYLGAQRIRLELYDNPILAAFYAEMYIHYVDSIFHILKDSLRIRPLESERFIQEASSIIPVRFKYSVNFLLWEAICKNQMDCDNSAYLVYDLGRKLDMEVSVVFLRLHAIVLVGDYAYGTTGNSYFKKEYLNREYHDVFLISSNHDSINALAALYEISNFLAVNGEYRKAKTFVMEGLKNFPNDPQLLQTMGDVYNFTGDYENAYKCYFRANKLLPDDIYISLNLNITRERLIWAGKKELVLGSINK